MKNSLILFFSVIVFGSYGQLYKNKEKGFNASFFSETPLENIQATTNKATSLINFQTDSIVVRIANSDFKFKNALMEEHFNENYMESEKHPNAVFRGKFDLKIDPKKSGVYKLKAIGYLELHGVRQNRTIEGTLEVTDGIKIHSEFFVKLVDHKIDVPKLVFEKIAENIKVTIDGQYVFFK